MTALLDRYAQVLLIAVIDAAQAPSVRNSQPWRWRIGGRVLELWTAPERRPAPDPDGRLLTISGGIALHHARIALAAAGWTARLDRLPEPDVTGLLARLTLTTAGTPEVRATRLLEAARRRHADPRTFLDRGVPLRVLHRLDRAAWAEDTRLTVLRQAAPPAPGAELLLYGPVHDRLHWLRAGEALSAVLLAAECEGLAVVLLDEETERRRHALHFVLDGAGEPYLLIRAGWPPAGSGPARAPRREVADLVEFTTQP